MGLFNSFRKQTINGIDHTTSTVEIPRDVFIEEKEPGQNGRTGHHNGSDQGIQGIYAFLQADYESRGYSDALMNPDDSYKQDNIKLLRHDLEILVQKVATYYEDIVRGLEFHILTRERAGLIDLVEQLKSRKELVLEHIRKVEEIKEEAENGEGMAQRVILSYQRGFMKGLMAISQSTVLNQKL